MSISYWLAVAAMVLVPGGDRQQNPWQEKVAPAVAKAKQARTVAAFRDALETAWRADDWQAGIELAREALQKRPNAPELHGPVARAFWRAGYVVEAERIAGKLDAQTSDRVGLAMLITTHLGRGQQAAALAAAGRLEDLPSLTAEDLQHVLLARMAGNRLEGIRRLVRRAQELINPDNGYPEIYLADQLKGLPEFFDAIGTEPVNQLTGFGAAPMTMVPLFNLPSCEVLINGRGPYRLIVDTGGSIMLSLDDEVAAELGLKSIAPSSIHGVSGKEQAGQALVDELKLGGATCRRVLTRMFAVRESLAGSADGILGTGVLSEGRMTLDFQDGRLVVAASSAQPGPGTPADLRVVGDAKLAALVSLQGEPSAALLDTGARLKALFPGKKITTVATPAFGVGAGRQPQISLTPGVDFVLAGRTYKNYGGLGLDVLDTLLGPLLGLQTDLLVGMPVIREMKTLTVDFPRCQMWIDWLERE
jgi:hypothetical protein